MTHWNPIIEPSDGASTEHLGSCRIESWVERELKKPEYPEGSYYLYQLLCRAADGGLGTIDLVEMVNDWSHKDHPHGPPPGLENIRRVLDCVDALTSGGFLARQADGLHERWTVLLNGQKREIPDVQKGDAHDE